MHFQVECCCNHKGWEWKQEINKYEKLNCIFHPTVTLLLTVHTNETGPIYTIRCWLCFGLQYLCPHRTNLHRRPLPLGASDLDWEEQIHLGTMNKYLQRVRQGELKVELAKVW